MRLQLTTLILATALVGCRDQLPVEAPVAASAAAAMPHHVAFLGVSDLVPEVGSTIIVTASIGVGDSLSMASFKVRLAYDAKSLHYLGDVELPGMMRVVNPGEYEIVVAGASGEGSIDGRLFAMKFRVDGAAGLKSLMLSVDELNDTNFTNQLPSLKQDSRLQLDRRSIAR